ncbi:MAG: aryl-sulfate sulfotransferase [Myxococcota bacterium]
MTDSSRSDLSRYTDRITGFAAAKAAGLAIVVSAILALGCGEGEVRNAGGSGAVAGNAGAGGSGSGGAGASDGGAGGDSGAAGEGGDGGTSGFAGGAAGSTIDLLFFGPVEEEELFIIDTEGQVLHRWNTGTLPGMSAYLIDGGHVVRAGYLSSETFFGGGIGGVVEELDWEGNVVWSWALADDDFHAHHDIEPLPDGHVLVVAWELKSYEEVIDAGGDPAAVQGPLWPDAVFEYDPTTDSVVWEWHLWDHLIQEFDATKANYGIVADHPELVDINQPGGHEGDWTHINSIDYHPELDQILLSVPRLHEIWVIDHSTTPAEAATHEGGLYGRGGDLLYRWGNPVLMGFGDGDRQQLFGQHDAEWIEPGLPGADNILLFNNGRARQYSSIIELIPPLTDQGDYDRFGPPAPLWEAAPPGLFSPVMSSAQRLPSGNTLICEGRNGRFLEMTPSGEIVWEYSGTGSVFRVHGLDSEDERLNGRNLRP